MTDMSPEAHHDSIARIFPRLGETGTTPEIIDLLAKQERLNMQWLALMCLISFGGAFLANAVPHLVGGVMGRPFQSPFAKPRGAGSPRRPSTCSGASSTSPSDICWYAVSAISICAPPTTSIALGLGALLIGLVLARHVRSLPRRQLSGERS